MEGQAVVDASGALASRGDGRFDREHLIGATVPQYAVGDVERANSKVRAVLRNAGEHGRVYLERTNLYPPI